MISNNRHQLDELITASAGMPIARYSIGSWRVDRPVHFRMADEALVHAAAMLATRIQVIVPNQPPLALTSRGGIWTADSGTTLEQVQHNLDKVLRSSITERATVAMAGTPDTGRLRQMAHARCDIAEMLQIQNIGQLLAAWREMRKLAKVSPPYGWSLAIVLLPGRSIYNLERCIAHVLRARASMIRAWPPTFAIAQAGRHACAIKTEASAYERDLLWQHVRRYAKYNSFYRMGLADALPEWRQQNPPLKTHPAASTEIAALSATESRIHMRP